MTHIRYIAAVRLLLAALITITAWLPAAGYDVTRYATSSRLSSGRWVKVSVTESGIYRVTPQQARDWGFSAGTEGLHVFGTGGLQLSEKLSSDLPDDLCQVPVVRNDDGSILFYAQGVTTFETKSGVQVPLQNTYSNAGYYFLSDAEGIDDIDIDTRPYGTSTVENDVTTYTERLFHETDITNPGETGRVFLGEDFRSRTSQDFDFALDGLVDGSTVNIFTAFACKISTGTASLTFRANGEVLPATAADAMTPVTDPAHDHYKWFNSAKTVVLPNGERNLKLNISFSSSGVLYTSRLDYIAVNYERPLDMQGRSRGFTFRTPFNQTGNIYHVASAAEGTLAWDVTTPYRPVKLEGRRDDATLRLKPAAVAASTIVVFDPASTGYPSPTFAADVDNQNLHGESVPDMIIISHKAYLEQAERVAQLHRDLDGMRVLVVDQEKVFNEFSSGTPDAMAYRMICKFFYDRGEDEGHRLGYLLLMGNGSYDNREISAEYQAIAYPKLLTWQTAYSNDETSSYTSDDVFTALEDDSGPSFYRERPVIAVGRFPVKSVSEARVAVNKLIKYVTTPNYGSWKNNVCNVADDGDQAVHMKQAEEVIQTARANGGNDMIFNRVYLDATTMSSDGAGNKYPEARKKMYSLVQDGVTWWNYTGHSGITTWTGDGLLRKPDLETELYYSHLPILYAATCEFTRYDAVETSGGEMMFLNNSGGAIAVICPPRLALVHSNGPLNTAVAKYIFARDSQNKPLRLGDIMLKAKNDYRNDDNTMRYFLFGDPAMRPAFPTYKAVVDEINGIAVDPENRPVFQARQSVTFKGHIEDLDGNLATAFNGDVLSTLYDCETSVVSHGYGEEGAEFVFQERANKLSINQNTIREGRFEIPLIIPSEVIASYDNYQPSLLSLYAYDPTGAVEANGSSDAFYIYGYDETVDGDREGPDILYLRLNNNDFKDGDNVGENVLVLARVYDESGINFSTAGIGHLMTLTLDDTHVYTDVVSYYSPDETPMGGSQGNIAYPLSDLEPGHHTLKLKLWDVFSNPSEQTITFNVITGMKPDIVNVYCDANPASVETNFYVQHNSLNANMIVTIEVFDLLGRTVWSTTQTGRSIQDTTFPINWNLCDSGGRRVPRGIYIFRATISTDGIRQTTKSKKLAVTAAP